MVIGQGHSSFSADYLLMFSCNQTLQVRQVIVQAGSKPNTAKARVSLFLGWIRLCFLHNQNRSGHIAISSILGD